MENIETGLLLMVVGMTTVFIILLIVINLGKGLIALVNKYAPEETSAPKQPAAVRSAVNRSGALATAAPVVSSEKPAGNRQSDAGSLAGILSNQEAAAIIAAVSVATAGQGKVIRIEKI